MLLQLKRIKEWETETSIQGKIFIDQFFECFTIERPRRYNGALNVHQMTCIPDGIYGIEMYMSGHFHMLVPLLKNVAGRSSIEIHIANESSQLKGCIGVGSTRGVEWVGHSRAAFENLREKIQSAIASGESISIEITTVELQDAA